MFDSDWLKINLEPNPPPQTALEGGGGGGGGGGGLGGRMMLTWSELCTRVGYFLCTTRYHKDMSYIDLLKFRLIREKRDYSFLFVIFS